MQFSLPRNQIILNLIKVTEKILTFMISNKYYKLITECISIINVFIIDMNVYMIPYKLVKLRKFDMF